MEKINQNNQITDIFIDFYPRALGAGDDHSFLMVVNGTKDNPTTSGGNVWAAMPSTPLFDLASGATAQLSYYKPDGTLQSGQSVSTAHDIMIFPSTHSAFGVNSSSIVDTYSGSGYTPAIQYARLQITPTDPTKNPVDMLNGAPTVNISKFRMVLYNLNTSQDIDIIDVLPNAYNPTTGYPFGMVVPTTWQWPTEGSVIDYGYPSFGDYRTYLLSKATNPNATASQATLNWFLNPVQDPNANQQYLYPAVPAPSPLPIP